MSIQLGTFASSTEFKTINICLEKSPQNIRRNWRPNHREMRDLMTEAAIRNEQLMEKLAGEHESDEYESGEYESGEYGSGEYGSNSPNASERSHVGTKTPVLGSIDLVTDTGHDAGLLSTIYEAYGNHHNLRTGPEDWWYTIIQTVALAIDDNSKSDEVRNFFVQHEGKKTLAVQVGAGKLDVENIDYSWLFDQFSQKIAENINVPEYVQQMIPNFSTTTDVHKIVSQITLMTSVQEFFEYKSYTLCGIPIIEMKGTENDWIDLGLKIKALRKTLAPLEDVIFKTNRWYNWWDEVEKIASKLLDTYNGNPDEAWWSYIITEDFP